jgi:hypothetical protein
MKNKRAIVISVVAAAVALAVSGSTMAYLTSTPNPRANQFTVGTLTPEIVENSSETPNYSNTLTSASGSTSSEGGKTIYTYTIGKEIKVTNSNTGHPIPAYVRVQLVPGLTDGEGNSVGGNFQMTNVGSNKMIFRPFMSSGTSRPFPDKDLTITLNFADDWNTNWFQKTENGFCYFYYGKILQPPVNSGDTTTLLLKSVTVSGADAKDYVNSFRLDVLTDAVQAEGGAIHSGSETPANPWPNVIIDNGNLKPKP